MNPEVKVKDLKREYQPGYKPTGIPRQYAGFTEQ